jgi:hypothetical protein
MERRLYDNSQFSTQYHGRTDGHYGVIQSITRFFKRSRLLLHLLCISSDRSDRRESTAAGQKPSFLLQNTPYALCFFGFSSLGFCFYLLGQPVLGVLRFSSARDPRWLAMRWSWDTWVGSARSGGIYTSTRLASLLYRFTPSCCLLRTLVLAIPSNQTFQATSFAVLIITPSHIVRSIPSSPTLISLEY